MNVTCNVIQDLLPLYAEELASDDSVALVREHLTTCAICRSKAGEIKAPVPVPAEPEDAMEKVRREIRRKRWMAVTCAVLIVCGMLCAVGSYLCQPIYLPVSVVESVGTDDAGRVKVSLSAAAAGVNSFEYDIAYEPEGAYVITVWTCRLLEMTTAHTGPRQTTFTFDPRELVGYFDGENDGNVEILYAPYAVTDWFIYLPRLVLGYYFLLALGLGAVLMVAAFFLRRKKAAKILAAMGTFLLCYAACQGVICEFSFVSFYAMQELVWALVMTACIWGAGLCAWKMRRRV